MENSASIAEAIIIISTVFLITLLGFFSVIVLYNRNRIKTIKDKQIYQQNLLSAKIETQEQTFENISQELHDNIGQQLTALNFQLENQKLKQPENKESLDKLSQTVSTIAQQLQTLSHSLNPNWLQHQGIIRALGQETERLHNISNISFQFYSAEDDLISLNAEQQIIVFRIFQEIINNAMKHAQATQIEVRVRHANPFTLFVKDNGKGFDINQQHSNGLGLQNIQHRADMIGFSCHIYSAINEGSSFLLTQQITP